MTGFDGQQEGERILYVVTPHPIAKHIAIVRIISLAVFFFLILWAISNVVPMAAGYLPWIGFIFAIVLVITGVLWNANVYNKSKTYITDRRVIRFDVVSPFFTTKRALFWNEALKAKAYAPNLLYRSMNIGSIDIEPQLAEHEDVLIANVYYFEDLANYIDKILFTFKNSPSEVASLRPFVPKPKGQRL